jgi:hypothetical protein
MDVTKKIQELLLSKDRDNYKIASEMLKTYPTLIDITFHPLLDSHYSEFNSRCDGLIGDGNGGSINNYFSNYGDGTYIYNDAGMGAIGAAHGNGYSAKR